MIDCSKEKIEKMPGRPVLSSRASLLTLTCSQVVRVGQRGIHSQKPRFEHQFSKIFLGEDLRPPILMHIN